MSKGTAGDWFIVRYNGTATGIYDAHFYYHVRLQDLKHLASTFAFEFGLFLHWLRFGESSQTGWNDVLNGDGALGRLFQDKITAVNFRTGTIRLARNDGAIYDSSKLDLLKTLKTVIDEQGISSTAYITSLFSEFQFE